jgi:hypothetical protein
MKIYLCTMYYNEDFMADCLIKDASQWADKIIISESSCTFKMKFKGYNLPNIISGNSADVSHVKIDGAASFVKNKIKLLRHPPFIGIGSSPWENEKIQRNASMVQKDIVNDDDVIIFSDIDEIFFPSMVESFIELIKKYGIVTPRFDHFLHFINNRVVSFPGQPDYSYRVFGIRGDFYKKMNIGYDALRKLGESGKLSGLVKCTDDIYGVHYSWLSSTNIEKTVDKLNSYSHNPKDHSNGVFNFFANPRSDYINDRMHKIGHLFDENGIKTIIDNSYNHVPSVAEHIDSLPLRVIKK